jgi:hypothetical protein
LRIPATLRHSRGADLRIFERDSHEGGGYGIETHHGRHKPAFAVLEGLRRR